MARYNIKLSIIVRTMHAMMYDNRIQTSLSVVSKGVAIPHSLYDNFDGMYVQIMYLCM